MLIGLIVAMQSEFDLVANIMEQLEIKTINHLINQYKLLLMQL